MKDSFILKKLKQCLLLNDKRKYFEYTKYKNSYFSLMMHGCMNPRRGGRKYSFPILLYIRCGSMVVMENITSKFKQEKDINFFMKT